MGPLNSRKQLISQEEFDMLINSSNLSTNEKKHKDSIANGLLVGSAIFYIALIFASYQNPEAIYNLSTVEMLSPYMTIYRTIYALIIAVIYYIGQTTRWHTEKIAYISFAMALNAVLMEISFTKIPDSYDGLVFFSAATIIKTLVIYCLYKNIKNLSFRQ
jgi:hypothetical protein